jgi:LEA14-like dessication related protein
MIGRSWNSVVLPLLLTGCTPLGLWVYDDPVVTVSRVTLELQESRRTGKSPLVVAIAVDNQNTYALSAERLELSLRLDGVTIGRVQRDSSVPVAMAAVSVVDLPLALQKQTTPERLAVLGSGAHKYSVHGRAIFRTPFGTRKVPFDEQGSMMFGERPSSSTN